MRTLSTLLVSAVAASATTAALMTLPAAATATPTDVSDTRVAIATSESDNSAGRVQVNVSAAAAMRLRRYDTAIRFLDFDHVRGYGSSVNVRGQVRAKIGSRVGALQGVQVTLLRRLDGSSRWLPLDTDYTSQRRQPKFEFSVRAKANAHYKAVYAGSLHFQRSTNTTGVSVYRIIDAALEDGTGRFHGRVHPRFAHRRIELQRRACPSCGWRGVDSDRTTGRSRFAFSVGAPRHGRTWWRVSVPATSAYIHSYSGIFTTQRQ